MKKVICIVLLIAVLFTGCQTKPADNPTTETPAPSAVTSETPRGTVTETEDENATQTPTVADTPQQPETAAPTETTTATSAETQKPTETPTKTAKPTPTPTATVAPKIKTFSIPISVAGGVTADQTKINFKGYYKNNDEKSGTVIISQDMNTTFTLTSSGNSWEFSSEYSKYPTALMSVKQQSTNLSKATVTVTLKAGTSVSTDAISMAQFVYVPKNTVNNGVPTLLINLDPNTDDYYNLISSDDTSVKDIWSEANYAIVEGKTKTYKMKDVQGTLRIKRRGFTSFGFDKKSYTIKLDDGQALLGMESNKDWVLAANYADKSLLRNYFSYQLGQNMKTTWAPDCEFIEVYIINGSRVNYLGNYLLVEKIEVSKEKVNIQEMTEKDDNIGTVRFSDSLEKVLRGSFLVELESFDRASTGDMLIQTDRYQLSVKSPDKDYFAPKTDFDPLYNWTWPDKHLASKNTRQAEYIRTFFNVVDEAIHTDDYATFSKYIDVDSFVDYYIINELAKNIDGNLRLSTYFYKDKGGKLKLTIWDFDVAYGNCDYVNNGDSATGFYIRTETSWYRHMFNTPEFRNKVRSRWNELRKGVLSDAKIESMLNNQAKVLNKSADANFERWPILGVYVWPNPSAIVRCDTYEENVEYLIDWIQDRAAWLDNNIDRAYA